MTKNYELSGSVPSPSFTTATFTVKCPRLGDVMSATNVSKIRADAESAALTVIEQTWDETQIPVNPVAIAELLGVKVFEANLPENVSGLIKKVEGFDAEIYIDASDGTTRRRFTCAHELGHFVKRQAESEIAFVDRRDGKSAEGTDEEEMYANAFAAALLMPKYAINKFRAGGHGIDYIARQLNVSRQSLEYRIANLGI